MDREKKKKTRKYIREIKELAKKGNKFIEGENNL